MGLWEDCFGGLDTTEKGHVNEMLDELNIKRKRDRRDVLRILGKNRHLYKRSKRCRLILERVRFYRRGRGWASNLNQRVENCAMELSGPLLRGQQTTRPLLDLVDILIKG